MLYHFIKPIVTLALWLFYRKIYVSNAQHVPKNKPVVLAANHPTGFIEPCILACYLEPSLHFLVRGDLFKNPFYIRLMRSLNLLPLYRAKDRGLAFVKTNLETFDFCYQALSEKKTVLILAEGSAEHEKRLRPLKKGTGRLAFGTLEKYPILEDVYIVPVGVNYTYAEKPRSEVMIDFGQAILAKDYLKDAQTNPNQATNDLLEELRQELEARIVIIEQEKDEELTEYLLQLDRTERPRHFSKDSKQPLLYEKHIADRVNQMEEPAKQQLLQLAKPYFERLKSLQISDKTLVQKSASTLMSYWLLLIGLPIFVTGYVLNAAPILLGKSIADKRVRRIEFYTSVWLAVAIGAYLIYWLLGLILLLIFVKPIWLLSLIVAPLLGIFALHYREFYTNVMEITRANSLNQTEKVALLQQRQAILDNFHSQQ